jgi:asparagine synthase (glutamine-hydrolysing)
LQLEVFLAEYTPPVAGIFGVVRFDEAPLDRTLVARMSAALAHRGPDALTCDGNTALGCRASVTTPGFHADGQPVCRANGIMLVFDGRLDNRDDLTRQLREYVEVSPDAPDAEVAACCYEVRGVEFARHLVGDFAVAVFDRHQQHAVLARDVIGIRPLYYRYTGAALFFASEIKALLVDRELRTRPNDRLLAELLLGRLHRRDDDGSTLFEGIYGVGASHVGIFTRARSDVRRYWDFDGRPAAAASFDECAEGLRYHLQRAVERRLRSRHPVAVAVSGGLDSSSIFCLARQSPQATPLVGLTYSTRDGQPSDESAFIEAVERASGQPIRYLNPPPAGVLFRAAEVVEHTEAPMLDAQWFRGERLLSEANRAGARTILTGHWGDQILFDQAYLVDLLHAGSWLAVRAHLKEFRHWFPDATGEFYRRLVADLLEHDLPVWVRRSVRVARRSWGRAAPWDDWYSRQFRMAAGPDVFSRDLSHAQSNGGSHVTVLARALYREVRSRYHAFCLEWNNKTAAQYGVDSAFPFLDRDLVEFVLGVPGPVLVRSGVPKALLRRALSDTVPGSILQRRTKGDFTAAVNQANRRDYQTIMTMLGPDALVVQLGYVDADKLQRGLQALHGTLEGSASCAGSWCLTGLVALELWLHRFADVHITEQKDRDHDQAIRQRKG